MEILAARLPSECLDLVKEVLEHVRMHFYSGMLIAAMVQHVTARLQNHASSLINVLRPTKKFLSADDCEVTMDGELLIVLKHEQIAYLQSVRFKLDADHDHGWRMQFDMAPLVDSWATPFWDPFRNFDDLKETFPHAIRRLAAGTVPEPDIAFVDDAQSDT